MVIYRALGSTRGMTIRSTSRITRLRYVAAGLSLLFAIELRGLMPQKKKTKRRRLNPKDKVLVWAGINHVQAQLEAAKAEILWRKVLDLT